jgi:hypothetical protein
MKPKYKRCSITLDLNTIRKCRELAAELGQTVSALWFDIWWLWHMRRHERPRETSQVAIGDEYCLSKQWDERLAPAVSTRRLVYLRVSVPGMSLRGMSPSGISGHRL